MDSREFLAVARELAAGATEAHWRSALGRAYYSLMLTARELLASWGIALPPGQQVHQFVRTRLIYSGDPDLRQVGLALERLGERRNHADYRLLSRYFVDASEARLAVQQVEDCFQWMEQVDQDAGKRSAAISGIRKAFP